MLLSPRSLLFFRKDWVNVSSTRTFDTSRGDNSDYILIVFRKDWFNGLFGRAFDTVRVGKVDYILCVFRKGRIIVLRGRAFDLRGENFNWRNSSVVFFPFLLILLHEYVFIFSGLYSRALYILGFDVLCLISREISREI